MDREKVLTWLEICGKNNDCSGCCPYSEKYGQCRESLMADAYDLLKEQEPVKPTYEDFFGNKIARCGKCNGYIVRYKYCPGCGQAVKWE